MRTIGLFAGRGELPLKIIAQCQDQNYPLFVIAFEGQTDPDLLEKTLPPLEIAWVHLGSIGEILRYLKAHQVTHIVMAGNLRRPSWSELKLDWVGLQWLGKLGVKALGDDGLLTHVIGFLKEEGFDLLSPTDILGDLLAPEGTLGLHTPDDEDWLDIDRGVEVARALGQVDVGQSVVIQQSLVLGVEAIEGTQALLARCHLLGREGRGGVLVKMAKPNQSQIVDLPTIGVHTVHQAKEAGLRGIAVEAGLTQVLDKEKVVQAANEAGLYFIGVPSARIL
jgi:DUF1009 family protein